jgi:hypothetical protein
MNTQNSMNILQASALTVELIKKDSSNPEDSLKKLLNGNDNTPEKLEALMNRSDVTGFRAHQLLKMASNYHNRIFNPLLKLYIAKFIKKGTRQKALCHAIMTLQLWIHFIGSSHELKSEEADELLPQVKPVLIILIKHWSTYRNSAIKLFDEIDQYFGRNYGSESKFPGDTEPPFRFDWIVKDELPTYIFPFIGRTLIELAWREGYYQKPEELLALATRDNFGDGDLAGQLYIKSIENKFTLTDINPFIHRNDDAMEKFLLSEQGKVAKDRFHALCEDAPADRALPITRYLNEYAGFNFSENKAYLKLTLTEKADFIQPYSSRLQLNHVNEQCGLLRRYVNDPEWQNPDRSISELTLLALQKRHIFSNNAAWLFIELMAVILNRSNTENLTDIRIRNRGFLQKIYSKVCVSISAELIDFQKPGLVIILFDMFQEEPSLKKTYDHVYGDIKRQIEFLFIEHLATCLNDYTTDEACEAVQTANACNSETVMDILVKRDLTFKQTFELLRKVKAENTDKPSTQTLRLKIIEFVSKIESDKDCLQTSIFLLASLWDHMSLHGILESALDRKSFLDLSLLLTSLQEIIVGGTVEDIDLGKTYVSEKVTGAIRSQTELRMESLYNTREQGLVFCQHQFFGDTYKNWYWFYGQHPLRSLEDLKLPLLDDKKIASIFAEGDRRENLVQIWKATPFEKVPMSFVMNYIFFNQYHFNIKVHLYEHPGWSKLSLKKRLALFTDQNKSEHEKLLPSLAYDFGRVWKEGKWTTDMYLKEIERIKPFDPDGFASLAVSLVTENV